MSDEKSNPGGPDLAKGIQLSGLADGSMLLGHVQGEAVLLARHGGELFAIGAICTHYGAPLEQGLLVDNTVSRDAATGRVRRAHHAAQRG